MDFFISRREVFNNLVRFKDNLLQLRATGKNLSSENQERIYKILLNRKTGDIRFAEEIHSLQKHLIKKKGEDIPSDFQVLEMVVETRKKNVHFDIQGLDDQPIEALAKKIAFETLQILNQKGEFVSEDSEKLPEEIVLKDLSTIHLQRQDGNIQDLAGWMGTLDRKSAENILEHRAVGTYLLRLADPLALRFTRALSIENHCPLNAYLLTFVKEEGIGEKLILQTDRGWLIYHDAPDLKNEKLYYYFPSIKSLLENIKEIAKYPLV